MRSLKAGAVLMLLILTACRSEPARTEAPDWILDSHPVLGIGFELVPEGQVAVLEDGDLTFAEYESATLATIACTTERGFPLRGDLTYDDAEHRFDYSLSGGTTGQAVAQALGECYAIHMSYLDGLWQWLHQPTLAERQAATSALSECLTTAGVESFPPPDTPQFREWHRSQPDFGPGSFAIEVADCLTHVESQFGFLPGQYGSDTAN